MANRWRDPEKIQRRSHFSQDGSSSSSPRSHRYCISRFLDCLRLYRDRDNYGFSGVSGWIRFCLGEAVCNHGTTTNLPTPSWPAVHGLLVGFVACSKKGVLALVRHHVATHNTRAFFSFSFFLYHRREWYKRENVLSRKGRWKLSGCFMVLIMTNRADFTISLLISKQSSALRNFVSQSFRPSFLRNWSIEQFPPMFHPLIRLNIGNIAITMKLKVEKKKKKRKNTRYILKIDLNQIIRSRYSIINSIPIRF